MTVEDIEKLIVLMGQTQVTEFQVKEGDCKVNVKFGKSAGAQPVAASVAAKRVDACSPGMGILRLVHPDQDRPFTDVGAVVKKGQTLGFVQNGELLEGIVSPHDGAVDKVVARDGSLIGFNDPVFELDIGR